MNGTKTAAQAGEHARKLLDVMYKDSKLPSRRQDVILFDGRNNSLSTDDIDVGRMIGKGAFGSVYKVTIKNKQGQSEGDGTAYALKCLDATIRFSAVSFNDAAFDLVQEAEILSRVNHPNVIRLVGMSHSNDNIDQAFMVNDLGYFLVLDLLAETLQQRLSVWCGKKCKGSIPIRILKCPFTKRSALISRLDNIMNQVAYGLEYLHSQNIVLRDLKPDNIGFDSQGVVKLFDFGFAREITSNQVDQEEMVPAGTLHYMAPEALRSLRSKKNPAGSSMDTSLDVYSFGMILWEVSSLNRLYKQHPKKVFEEKIVKNNWRPSTTCIPSKSMRMLIQMCWDKDPAKRPSFSKIVKTLDAITSNPMNKVDDVLSGTFSTFFPQDKRYKDYLGKTNIVSSASTATAEDDEEEEYSED